MEPEIAIVDICICLCFGDYFFIASGDDGFLLQKTLLIEKGEDFFIVQLIVVPLIGVLRVSLALRRSTSTLPSFNIVSIFVLPPCFVFILGIFAVSFIKESSRLIARLLGSFSQIKFPREWVLYAVVIYIDLASIFLISIICTIE